jgi:hypothetical protein
VNRGEQFRDNTFAIVLPCIADIVTGGSDHSPIAIAIAGALNTRDSYSQKNERRGLLETWVILFAVTEFLGTGSQVPLLLVIDAI